MNYVVFNLGPKLYDMQIIGKNRMEEIEDFIIHKIHKSVTIYTDAMGGYSREPKVQMSCVCNSKEYIQLREFIKVGNYDCFIKVIPLIMCLDRTGISISWMMKISSNQTADV